MSEDNERKAFEEATFRQRFLSSIRKISDGQLSFTVGDCPMMVDFVKRTADGAYTEEGLNFAWWGWSERAKVGVRLSEMSVQELQALRAAVDMRLHHLVLGDPSKGVTIGPDGVKEL